MSTSFPSFDPIANLGSIVLSGKARFTILTDRLIRLELDPEGSFEDRASLTYWVRNLPTPDFEVSSDNGWLLIETQSLKIHFFENDRFHWRDLWIENKTSGQIWRYGDEDHQNLGGTTRTLDSTVGPIDLDPGLVSRSGWAIVDDSQNLVFDEYNWPTPRNKKKSYKDLYFYGYAQNYLDAILDHQLLTGKPGLLPRWALGNWWSRYWAYHDTELLSLMDDFAAHEIPLSVCIVDMDWHMTKTGNQSSGWTGYSWNRELFPNPESFIFQLHKRGLKTALNLHPAEGVHAHEDAYFEMATRMGISPASQEAIPFDIANPSFVKAYFESLHHPLEAQGIDFWWLDWQQGSRSKIDGLDPLFWLNHLHYYDQGKTSDKRPFIFSRWPGLGGHRYPIGFSGDTVVDWKSLAFQPQMTASASNVAYGWWSHDIGGHAEGIEDPELYLRWVQYGVFSPIFRLHSTNNPFIDRRPWGFNLETLHLARSAMQLRHRLIPLLYTANWHNAQSGEPIILPMYYRWAKEESAYQCPGQYLFCRQLFVAPVTEPIDPMTGSARKTVWLPEGEWFNFETYEKFQGGYWYSLYARLQDIPVFVQPGAIIPMDDGPIRNGVSLPTELTVKVFTGKDSSFNLYEDAGEGQSFMQGEFAVTEITQRIEGSDLYIKVSAPIGNFAEALPENRAWSFEVVGITEPTGISSELKAITWEYDHSRRTLQVNCPALSTKESIEIKLTGIALDDWQNTPMDRLSQLITRAKLPSLIKQQFMLRLPEVMLNPAAMFKMAHNFTKSQLLAIYECLIPASDQKPAQDQYNAFEAMMTNLRKLISSQSE